MRILFITHSTLGEGGSLCQTATLGTVGSLSKLGWDISLMSTSNIYNKGKNEINGFNWYQIPSTNIPGMQSLLLERAAKKVLKKALKIDEYDIIMINWSLCRTLIPIVKRHNIPVIVDDRSPPVHENLIGKMQWLHYHYSWKYASKNGDGYSFNSLELQEMVTKKYSLNKGTCVYPSATYPERYTKSNLDKEEQVVLVYHGLLDKERSVYEIFKASREILERGRDIKLIMFGKGNDSERLGKLSKENEWFDLLPPCRSEEVPERLSKAHIGIIPLPDKYQWRFSSPLKLFEYAAAGLNVIATDIRCHQVLGDREWLKLIGVDDISSNIANEVIKIIDSGEWQENSELAYKEAKNEFSWDESVKSLDALIRNIIRSNL